MFGSRVVQPRRSFAEWSAQMYGPGWRETKDRYWTSPWTWKRCVWCWRGLKRTRRRQLNHLTYRRVDPVGRTPLWTVVPMCHFCHRVETWITKRRRPRMRRRQQAWAHARVTFGVMALLWMAAVVLVGAAFVLVAPM